jgi:hypothetical protein
MNIFSANSPARKARRAGNSTRPAASSNSSSIGQVGIVPRNGAERYILASSLMKLTCDRKQVEPLFLFYFFRKYQNRSIETAAVIEELIALAKPMREAAQRGQGLGLSDDEVAFYDALEVNDSAVKVLGDENLRLIARDLLKTIRENVSIDWTAKESVRAKLRVMVKRVLRKFGYPPDKQERATQTVLQQAELLCADWAP